MQADGSTRWDSQEETVLIAQAIEPEETEPPRTEAPHRVSNAKMRIAASVLLVLVALISVFVLRPLFSSPEVYSGTIQALDQKKDTVMVLVGVAAGSSTAVSALPGDMATPLAEKLMDLSSDFVVVLTAIYLEKYLLTIFGFATFAILLPACCVLMVMMLLRKKELDLKSPEFKLSAKLFLFGVVLMVVVPASVLVDGMVESTYQESIDDVIQTAQEVNAEQSVSNEALDEALKNAQEEAEKNASLLDRLGARVDESVSSLTGQVNDAIEQYKAMLNNLFEAFVLLVVTSCIIPILTLIFFLWISKLILGLDLSLPSRLARPRVMGTRR